MEHVEWIVKLIIRLILSGIEFEIMLYIYARYDRSVRKKVTVVWLWVKILVNYLLGKNVALSFIPATLAILAPERIITAFWAVDILMGMITDFFFDITLPF